ncbi:MAG: PASTA domain-containing protein [Fimbriimonadaceae bacterium]
MVGSLISERYEITAPISETAMFDAYAADDRLQGREVCIRFLRPPFDREPEYIARLGEVIRAISTIQHPQLERLVEVDSDGEKAFVISEYSPGSNLVDRLRKLGSLSVPVSVATAILVCEGVQALHAAGVAHGDIGSHNIVVSPDGAAKVQLFGVWQSYSASATAGQVVLKQMAPYLAPEIGRGAFPSPASDVYAIGILLYELLAGRHPFHAEGPVALAMKHSSEAAPNVRMMNPSVPMVLAEIIKKAMSKEPVLRYKNAGDFASDLRILQDALKFGRTLTWPIRDEAVEVVEKQPVAPKMPAVKELQKKEKKPKEKKEKGPKGSMFEEEPDVPVWLKTIIAFCAGLFAVMVLLWVVYNMNRPKTLKVPDLRNLTYSEAATRLTNMGLKARVGSKRSDEAVPSESVISTDPPKDDPVFEGRTISLTVSSGSRMVVIPDVSRQEVDKARALLSSMNFSVTNDVIEERSTKIEAGKVIGTAPDIGKKVERGSEIRLRISSGSVDPKTDPSANKRYAYEIKITLLNLESPVELKVEMVDTRGTRVIHKEDHDPNEEVLLSADGYGKEVTFKVYYDGDLVKTFKKTAGEDEAAP